jgi:branched-chain amino acid transport system permease protein
MSDVLSILILGLATASIYAIAASGLVVTYTTSGIFNFAHGAIAMLSAFVYWQLRSDDAWGLPAPIAIVLVLFVFAPAVGVVIDRVIMRNLHDASTITKIVVSVGLLVALIGLANVIWPPAEVQPNLAFFFGDSKVSLGDVNVEYHRIVAFFSAIVVAVGLRFVLYRTSIGVAMRAVVDSRELAALNGADPGRVSAASWMLGCMLAALAGILIPPLLAPVLDSNQLTLLVINAYAAALVGRLKSLPMTVVGAVILGISIEAVANVSRFDIELPFWLNRDTVPVLMLFIVLMVVPQDRAGTGEGHQRLARVPSPSLRSTLVAGAVLIAVAAAVPLLLGDSDLSFVGYGVTLGIVMLSLVPLTGYAGQISLAQLGLAGVGAIVMFEFGADGELWALALAIAVTAGVGALIALPALRLRGLYLALATMAFALFLEKAVFNQVDGFEDGSASIQPLSIFNLRFESAHSQFVFLVVVFVLVGLLVLTLRRGAFGRRLQAMKDSPAACSTLGLDLTRTKLEVFSLSAAIAALGGVLLATWRGQVGPENYALITGALPGLPVVLLAVVGGIASVGGALFGGVALAVMPLVGDKVPSLSDLMLLLPGLVGISLAQNPDGAVAEIVDRVKRLGDRPSRAERREARKEDRSRSPVAAAFGLDGRNGSRPEPEQLAAGGPMSDAELAAVDDELGLSWSTCREQPSEPAETSSS